MATLSNPAYEATTPVVEYNLSNEATTVRRTIPGPAAPSTIEYGDWGLVSGDGTVDYDFTVSDSQLLFLESAGNIRHDIMRERIDDRTKKGMFSLIQSYAVDDLVHEIQEAGLWTVYVRGRLGPEPYDEWNFKKYHHSNAPSDDPSFINFPVALRLTEAGPNGRRWVQEVRGHGDPVGPGEEEALALVEGL